MIDQAIFDWLSRHCDIDACIWTGLPSNWMQKRKVPFTIADSLAYLETVENLSVVREYIEKAPDQIETRGRAAIRKRFGWQNVPIPGLLLEAP